MSRRDDRERERDRGERSSRQAAARTNEYFVPKDGIDREVITADICRYLGNDALVRPGNYENPQTRVVQQGYFITAYRNLTTAMIADLKADSERWEAERRQTASRGQPQNVEYRSSTTHQSRQYYGPTGEIPPSIPAAYSSTAGYGQPATAVPQQPVAYDPPQYQSSAYTSQPATGYPAPQQYATPQDSYFVPGSNLAVDLRADRAAAQPRTAQVPPGGREYASNPSYQQQPDPRAYYGQSGPSSVPSSQYAQQPTDAYYGRAGGYDTGTPEAAYDARYQDPGAYSQAPPSSSSSATATSGSSRRERDRDSERDSGRHHRSRRN